MLELFSVLYIPQIEQNHVRVWCLYDTWHQFVQLTFFNLLLQIYTGNIAKCIEFDFYKPKSKYTSLGLIASGQWHQLAW